MKATVNQYQQRLNDYERMYKSINTAYPIITNEILATTAIEHQALELRKLNRALDNIERSETNQHLLLPRMSRQS